MGKKILEIIKNNFPMLIVLLVMVIGFSFIMSNGGSDVPLENRGGAGTSIFSTTTSTLGVLNYTDYPIVDGPALLHKIAIGKVGTDSPEVALFDSTIGTNDNNIIFYMATPDAQVWSLDVGVNDGIMINTTNQSNVMLFYTPLE